MNRYHACFDLELELPKTNPQTPDSVLDQEKIIQLGYVIYKLEPEFEVVTKNEIHIEFKLGLSAFIKKLTGISDYDVFTGVPLEEAFNQMADDVRHYKASRILNQWGGGDDTCLRAELPNVQWPFGHSARNIKHMYQVYAEANGIATSGGLSKSMNKLGLKFEGRQHGAMADAYNTAKVHAFLYNKFKQSIDK